MWRELPAEDWRNTTVFKGNSLKESLGHRLVKDSHLINNFGITAKTVAAYSKADRIQVWRDQVAIKFAPMSTVSLRAVLAFHLYSC